MKEDLVCIWKSYQVAVDVQVGDFVVQRRLAAAARVQLLQKGRQRLVEQPLQRHRLKTCSLRVSGMLTIQAPTMQRTAAASINPIQSDNMQVCTFTRRAFGGTGGSLPFRLK